MRGSVRIAGAVSAMRVRPSSNTMPWSEIFQRALGVLLDHQDRDAALAHGGERREQFVDHQRREADRGLVDHHQLRLEQQRARDLQDLLFTARQRGRLRVRLAAQHREAIHRGVETRCKVEALGRHHGAEFEIVAHRQLGKNVAALRHVRDAARQQLARLQVGDVCAFERDAPRAGRQHAEHGLEHGGFSCAVRADHRGDRAARDLEARAVQDRHLAVSGDDVGQRQDRISDQDTPR